MSKDEEVGAGSDEVGLSGAIAVAREASVLAWAKGAGMPLRTDAEVRVARETFSRLPYEERRKAYVRPRNAEPDVDSASAVIAAYKASGDASHALRTVGVELGVPWVEQKRNSGGMVEILASDLSGEETLEEVEERAVGEGLYNAGHQDLPATVEEEIGYDMDAKTLLALARERLPSQQFGVFLAVKVDGQPIRKVMQEFNLSYRQVWQTVDFVRDSLRRFAREAAG